MMVSWQFSTRQAKVVMGVIAAGATLGSITGGFLARWLSGAFGVWAMLPAAGWSIFLAFAASLFLKGDETAPESSLPPPDHETAHRRKFIITLLALVAVSTIAFTLIEFLFKTSAQAHHRSAVNLANFFGSFYAILGIITLVVQITGIPPFLRRFGVPPSLHALPLSLFIANGLFLITGSFGAVILLRGTEDSLRHSIDRSTLEVLYVALPGPVRTRVKSLIDTIGVRIPEAATSLLLILLFTAGMASAHLISVLNAGVIIVWLVLAFLLGSIYYPSLLKEQIQGKNLDFDSVRKDLFTKDFYRVLPEIFRNAEKDTILGILEILETSDKRWLGRYLLIALEHEDPEIRLKSLVLLFDQDANLSDQIKHLVSDKDNRIRREAVHYLCVRSRSPQKIGSKFEEDPDPVIRTAICTCSRRGVLTKGSYAKLEKFVDDFNDTDGIDVRLEVAHVLKYTKSSLDSIRLLKRLLSDPSDQVRKATLKSIEAARPAALIPELLRISRYSILTAEVSSALASYGKILFPQLERILNDRTQMIRQKKIALKVAADIGGNQALALILKVAGHENLTLRFSAIKALNHLKKNQSLRKFHPALRRLLNDEIRTLQREINRAQAFTARPDGIMNRVVRQRIVWAAERVFRYLGLFYDSDFIYYAYLAWTGDDDRRTDTALELLEQTLSPDLRGRIVPLLEMQKQINTETTKEERSRAFHSYMKEGDPLLVASAIEELSRRELLDWLPPQIHVNPLVVETLNRRKRMTDEPNTMDAEQPLTKIQKMEALSKIDLFSKLGPQELLLLADQATDVQFESGQIIFKEGEVASEFIALLNGEVELTRESERVSLIGPGESFGMHEVLTEQPRFFSATAIRPCSCLRIARNTLWEIMEDYSTISQGIIQVLVQQIQSLTERLTSIKDLAITESKP